MSDQPGGDPRARIGVILAYCLGFFLIAFALFAAIEAWHDPTGRGAISENATQILSTVAGGIIGILAGYVGGMEATTRMGRGDTPTPDTIPPPTLEDPNFDGYDQDGQPLP